MRCVSLRAFRTSPQHGRHGGRVGAAGKRDAEGSVVRKGLDGAGDRISQRFEVAGRERLHVGAAGRGRGGEEPAVTRIRIGAPDLVELREVVRRNEPGVGRMKLPFDSFPAAIVGDRVDAVGDDEVGPGLPFRHEIAKRSSQGPGEADRHAVARGRGESALDSRQRLEIAGSNDFLQIGSPGADQEIVVRMRQVDEAGFGSAGNKGSGHRTPPR